MIKTSREFAKNVVLVAEDDPRVMPVIVATVSRVGIGKAIEVGDGEAALAIIGRQAVR